MNRSAIRENAFKLIYSLEIQKTENLEEQIDLFFESNNIEDEQIFFYLIGLNEYASVPFSFYQNLLKKCKIKNPKKCVSIDIYNFRKYFKMRSIL